LFRSCVRLSSDYLEIAFRSRSKFFWRRNNRPLCKLGRGVWKGGFAMQSNRQRTRSQVPAWERRFSKLPLRAARSVCRVESLTGTAKAMRELRGTGCSQAGAWERGRAGSPRTSCVRRCAVPPSGRRQSQGGAGLSWSAEGAERLFLLRHGGGRTFFRSTPKKSRGRRAREGGGQAGAGPKPGTERDLCLSDAGLRTPHAGLFLPAPKKSRFFSAPKKPKKSPAESETRGH
jgi:hypothetical protein